MTQQTANVKATFLVLKDAFISTPIRTFEHMGITSVSYLLWEREPRENDTFQIVNMREIPAVIDDTNEIIAVVNDLKTNQKYQIRTLAKSPMHPSGIRSEPLNFDTGDETEYFYHTFYVGAAKGAGEQDGTIHPVLGTTMKPLENASLFIVSENEEFHNRVYRTNSQGMALMQLIPQSLDFDLLVNRAGYNNETIDLTPGVQYVNHVITMVSQFEGINFAVYEVVDKKLIEDYHGMGSSLDTTQDFYVITNSGGYYLQKVVYYELSGGTWDEIARVDSSWLVEYRSGNVPYALMRPETGTLYKSFDTRFRFRCKDPATNRATLENERIKLVLVTESGVQRSVTIGALAENAIEQCPVVLQPTGFSAARGVVDDQKITVAFTCANAYSADSDADLYNSVYQIETRANSDSSWNTLINIVPGTTEWPEGSNTIAYSYVVRNMEYDSTRQYRVRGLNYCGAQSEWIVTTNIPL